jgi:hypothetical protein
MGHAIQSELWRDLYLMLGTSAAALIGLLFIVSSLHLDEIVNNPAFRLRARNNTLHLVVIFIESMLILTPQPMPILGAELAAINLFGLQFPLSFAYRYFYKDRETGQRGGWSKYRSVIYIAGYLLGIAGSAILIGGSNGGLYPVTASCGVLLVLIVSNAWSIMAGVGLTEKTTKTKRGTARQVR